MQPHPGVRPMTGDVHQGDRGSHEVVQLGGREAVGCPVVAGQRRQVGEAELLGHLAEVLPIGRLLEGARAARGVHAAVRSNLLDERDFEAQGLEAQRPAQAGPGRAAVVELVGQSTADEDDGHEDDASRVGIRPRRAFAGADPGLYRNRSTPPPGPGPPAHVGRAVG